MTDEPETPTWDDLKDLIRWCATIFGEPRQIWHEWAAPRSLALSMRGWVQALEAIARALLLSMAAGLPRPASAPSRTRSGRKPSAAPKVDAPAPNEAEATEADAADDSEANSDRWLGVSFRLAPPELPEASRPWGEPRFEQRRSFFIRSLAFRFEAVIRVAENPQRYAARMAQRLWRKPGIVERVLRPPTPPRGCRSYLKDNVADAQAHARIAAETFNSG